MRKIKNIAISITNACNRNCIDCASDIPEKIKTEGIKHMPVDEFDRVIKYFDGYDITLTGGEPTMHPEFEKMANIAYHNFSGEYLGLETNGYLFDKEVFDSEKRYIVINLVFFKFNAIHLIEYQKGEHFTEMQDNSHLHQFIKKHYPGLKLHVHPMIKHVSRKRIGGGNICESGLAPTIKYIDGLLYPCCVANGVPNAIGIPITKNWLDEIVKVKMPCSTCFLSKP